MKWLLLLLLALPALAGGVEDQASEFRRLREVKGHFQGGPEWIADVDTYGGRKHVLMQSLAAALAKSSAARVLELLGEADAKAEPDSPLWAQVRATETGAYLLIYRWRGDHDFLYFLVDGSGHVARSSWWMAYE